MNPSGHTPLAGLLSFTTDRPTRATLRITDDQNHELMAPTEDAFTTAHALIVLGLRPDRRNTVEVSLEAEGGAVADALSIDVTTRPLPDSVPAIDVKLSRPARMEPGITLVPVFDASQDSVGFTVAIDPQGDVLWYYDSTSDEPRRISTGNFLSMNEFAERRSLIEYDMLGRVVRQWWATNIVNDPPSGAIPVAIDDFHHDIIELPSGHFLTLSTEIRHIDDYPTSNTDPVAPREPRDIAVDVLYEFDPATGDIVRSWKLFDLIDPNRIPQAFQATDFYKNAYDDILDEPPIDWSHGNGLAYIEETDSLILSIRKQCAVIKIDLGTGKVRWILGDPTGWGPEFADLLLKPVGDVDWFYGQHAPEITPDGTLLLYDNGAWGRAFPPNEPETIDEAYSRAVEYAIDEDNMTVQQLWSYGSLDGDRFYSSFVSEVDTLPQTGNLLLSNGGQEVDDQSLPAYAGYEVDEPLRVKLSVYEVTHTVPPEKLWDMEIDTLDGSWGVFRTERLPGLYP